MRVIEWINEHASRAWAPGDVDCLLVLADWCIANGHSDPASHLRSTYHDEDGYRAVIAAHGSAVEVVTACAARIGLRRVSEARCGHIAVIGSPKVIERQWGAIFDGGSWRVRGLHGFPAMCAKPLAIWRV